jgi:exopolysaccharide biosynthesis polyprenyl glycosylphosphotransferase
MAAEIVETAAPETLSAFGATVGVKRHRRGWLVRRALVVADVLGLTLACGLAIVVSVAGSSESLSLIEVAVFLGAIPVWVVLADLYGLYSRDGERTDHSTVDDAVGVLNLVTLGSWLIFIACWATDLARPEMRKLVLFWAFALVFMPTARALARAWCKRQPEFMQNTLIVGAGDVGQLIARKLVQHPEYGINLVGFFDDKPKPRRTDLGHLTLLGPPPTLGDIVASHDIERIVVAYSNEPDAQVMASIRELNELDVQIDLVPRLHELVGPHASLHSVEALQLLGLPPVRITRTARWMKRTIDIVGALVALTLTAPLFAFIAFRVWRDSGAPVFYRQTRLGMNQREFTALKFRTMHVGTVDGTHREYIRRTMSDGGQMDTNGMFKLDRPDAVTRVGAWLRRTSLDELPQFVNVLRGDMSLVGPRPCIPYETTYFQPHHFERFLVPQGMTGLWQVAARAQAPFVEALDMDVAYVRGRSLSLDLRLLFRTPVQLLRGRKTA